MLGKHSTTELHPKPIEPTSRSHTSESWSHGLLSTDFPTSCLGQKLNVLLYLIDNRNPTKTDINQANSQRTSNKNKETEFFT